MSISTRETNEKEGESETTRKKNAIHNSHSFLSTLRFFSLVESVFCIFSFFHLS